MDPAYNRAIVARWTEVDGILFWNVHRNCSSSSGQETFRVVEPEFVDNQRENSTCSYRIQACNQEGCGPLSQHASATFSTRPDPPTILTVTPSSSGILTVTYSPPANRGGGGGVDVKLNNFEVQLSQTPDFTTIISFSRSEDGTSHSQRLHALKGSSYFIRARAANAIGWSDFSVFVEPGSNMPLAVRSLSVPGPPSSIAAVLPVDVRTLQVDWGPPLDTGAWDTSEAVLRYRVEASLDSTFQRLVAVKEVAGNVTSVLLYRLPLQGVFLRVSAANIVGFGIPWVAGGRSPTEIPVLSVPSAPSLVASWTCMPAFLCVAFLGPGDNGGGEKNPFAPDLLGFRAEACSHLEFYGCVVVEANLGDVIAWSRAELQHDQKPSRAFNSTLFVARFPNISAGTDTFLRVFVRNQLGWGRAGVLDKQLLNITNSSLPFTLPSQLGTIFDVSQLFVNPSVDISILPVSPPLLTFLPPPSPSIFSHLRLFLRFSPSLPFDSSGYFMHARVHGAVGAGRGVFGAGLQLGGANLSGFLELPNVLRECERRSCEALLNETGGGVCLPEFCLPSLSVLNPQVDGISDWSLSVWFASEDTAVAQVIAAIPSVSSSFLEDANLAIVLEGGSVFLVLMAINYSQETVAAFNGPSPGLSSSSFHLLVVSFSRSTSVLSLYLDGRHVSSFFSVPSLPETSGPILLGSCNCTRRKDGSSLGFQGVLDSLEIWDRVVVEEEVKKLFRSGGEGKEILPEATRL
uniref:Fibronectin type-III domain-containing protein n=1 Tax=Guillardia theta TaxID=55529 RepID=A0A7S4JQB0_GUITH